MLSLCVDKTKEKIYTNFETEISTYKRENNFLNKMLNVSMAIGVAILLIILIFPERSNAQTITWIEPTISDNLNTCNSGVNNCWGDSEYTSLSLPSGFNAFVVSRNDDCVSCVLIDQSISLQFQINGDTGTTFQTLEVGGQNIERLSQEGLDYVCFADSNTPTIRAVLDPITEIKIIGNALQRSAWGVVFGLQDSPDNKIGFGLTEIEDCFQLGPLATRIITVSPENGTTTATSTPTTIGATGYANEDIDGDLYLQINIRNNAYNSSQMVGPTFAFLQENPTSYNYQFDLSGGEFNHSTTTTITQIGRYTQNTQIVKKGINFFGIEFFEKIITASTTSFLVATSTKFDLIQDDQFQMALDLLEAEADECFTIDLSTWSAVCVYRLFVPNSSDIQSVFVQIRESFENKIPFSLYFEIQDKITESINRTGENSMADVTFTAPNSFINGTIDIINWDKAKENFDNSFSENARNLLVRIEWLAFSIYLIVRMTKLL